MTAILTWGVSYKYKKDLTVLLFVVCGVRKLRNKTKFQKCSALCPIYG